MPSKYARIRGGVRHDHDLLAIVAIGPRASQGAAKHERDREPKIESCESQGKFGLLLWCRIEDLRQINVQRKSRHAAADDRQRLGGPHDDKGAETVTGRSVSHRRNASAMTACTFAMETSAKIAPARRE